MALPKESSSVEISSLRPVEVPASKQPHAITEPSNHVETPPTQLSQNRSQSVSKIVPITKEATTPIYVIDHFKHGARYEVKNEITFLTAKENSFIKTADW